jgi:phage gpG-like protein
MSFRVTIQGGKELILAFDKLNWGERRDLLSSLAERQIRNIDKGLRAGTVLSGARMEPSLRAMRDGGQTLIDKGHMAGAMKVLSLSSKAVVIGFGSDIENKKARTHQEGRTIKPKKGKYLTFPGPKGGLWGKGGLVRVTSVTIPARPWFGFRPGDMVSLQSEVDEWSKKKLNKAGLT